MPQPQSRQRTRRGTIGKDRLSHPLNVRLTKATRERIDKAAKRYHVAAGLVARYAIEAGLKSAIDRLRKS